MSYSLNEIEALSKKAARGAGLSWGMSEEAAKATRWLVSHGLPAARLLADLLNQTDRVDRGGLAPVSFDGVWQAKSGQLCPLASGAAVKADSQVGCASECRAQCREFRRCHPTCWKPSAKIARSLRRAPDYARRGRRA